MTGRFLNERLGKIHFWISYVGFLLSFMPMHFAGLYGMPRRVAAYDPKFQLINIISSLGAFLLGVGQLPFFINAAVSVVAGERADNNPWRALTLEWTTSSPPPEHNYDETPIPIPNPYAYGSPMAAAYLAGERNPLALQAAHGGGPIGPPATSEHAIAGDK